MKFGTNAQMLRHDVYKIQKGIDVHGIELLFWDDRSSVRHPFLPTTSEQKGNKTSLVSRCTLNESRQM